MTWHETQTWDEDAFVGEALLELTDALGLHWVINNLDDFPYSTLSRKLVDLETANDLRRNWLQRVMACFPKEWHVPICNDVASAEHFYLALVSHLDQVRFVIHPPRWIKAFQIASYLLGLVTIIALLMVVAHPQPFSWLQPKVITVQVAPMLGAILGFIAYFGERRFRKNRAATVSQCVRQELRTAINHAFAHPITKTSGEMAVLSQLDFAE